ncbi:MAG TPA: endonuclease/exonuclease/phosphatase family protein [Candidatus Angelobacter sp.]|nr:endonuclease/exonuclease/phosphatase family protein [Candidatus Angelobacter sp.]
MAAEGAGLRLITLNCNGGNESAAAEVKAFHPDLVFFEESPLRPVVRKMATNLLGADAKSFCSSDVSLLARGKVTPVAVENQESAPFIHAKVKFSSGFVTDVIVLRLQPYNIRADLWSPECWRNQAAIRRRQREQFEWIRRELDKIPPNEPILLGGDFNLPAGDKLFGILKPRVRETFREAGHGWGDTLDDNIPVLRIDQIWCDEHFRVVSSEAHQTVNSDHRMVICNLSIVGSGEAESREKTDVPLSKK